MISSKNLTLLLAVLIMGFCLISSVSAMDIDDSASVSDSSVSLKADENSVSDSNLNSVESDAGSSNVNSENEVLSTDNTVEDSDLEYDSSIKSGNNLLGASSQSDSDVLQATAKTKTTLKGSSSTVYRGNSYTLTLTDNKGKVLSGQKVSYKVNGKTYTLTTDSKGSTYLQINLKEGKYTMVCSYGGSSAYASSSFSVTLSVLKNPNAFSIKEIEDAAIDQPCHGERHHHKGRLADRAPRLGAFEVPRAPLLVGTHAISRHTREKIHPDKEHRAENHRYRLRHQHDIYEHQAL